MTERMRRLLCRLFGHRWREVGWLNDAGAAACRRCLRPPLQPLLVARHLLLVRRSDFGLSDFDYRWIDPSVLTAPYDGVYSVGWIKEGANLGKPILVQLKKGEQFPVPPR